MTRALYLLLPMLVLSAVQAADTPWGHAKAAQHDYEPQKVVYDVIVERDGANDHMNFVLDRVSYLSKLYEAHPFKSSIIIVMHGNEIPLFAIENYADNEELMKRAQSLTIGTNIEFRMCELAAEGHGYQPKDIHGFVHMVPMADAELVRLQHEGHAYMR